MTEAETPTPDILEKSIDDIGLSVRARNALWTGYTGWRDDLSKVRPSQVRTVGDLVQLTEADVLKMKNLGRKTLKEVKLVLADLGLTLRRSTTPSSGLTIPQAVALLREAQALIGWRSERALRLHAQINAVLKDWES